MASDTPNPLPGWHATASVSSAPTDAQMVVASHETDDYDQGLFDLLLRMVAAVRAAPNVMGSELAGEWYDRITGYLRLTERREHSDGSLCPICGPRPTPTGGWPDEHDRAMQPLRREQFREMQ